MDLLLVSPLPPLLIILGKVTPYVLLSFINAIVILAMGYFIFDVPILGNLILLLSLCLLYLLTALALGVLISDEIPHATSGHDGLALYADDAHDAAVGLHFSHFQYAGIPTIFVVDYPSYLFH